MGTPKHTETICKEKCACCKSWNSSSGFQKIIEWSEGGLIIYRHTNRIDEINKTTGQLESSVKTKDDVFILQKTKDIRIKPFEHMSEMVENVSCPRCKELVHRVQKYLKNTPFIEKKVTLSVCDHCRTKKQSQNVCDKCGKVVEKFLAERHKQSVSKQKIKDWLSKVQKIIENVSITKKSKSLLHSRAHSDYFLNDIYNQLSKTTRHLNINPILPTGVKISESMKTLDESTIKSESALIFIDTSIKKSKTTLTTNESTHQVDKHATSSKIISDTESERIEKALDVKGLLKKVYKRGNECEIHTQEKTFQALKKYHSDEYLFISSAVLAEQDVRKIFSYVFPKNLSDDIVPLRKVKTSAELIVDTKEMLRLRALAKNNQGVQIQKAKQKNKTSIIFDEQSKLMKKKSEESRKGRDGTSSVRNNESKSKIVHLEKHKKDKVHDKRGQERDISSQKEKTDAIHKGKEVKKEKRLKTENKEHMKEENETRLKFLKYKVLKQEKEEKLKRKEEERLKRERDEKQKLQDKQITITNNKDRDKEKRQKENDNAHAINIQTLKWQEEENKRSRMEADKKSRDDTAKRLQENDKQTTHTTQEKPSTKEINVSQVKVRRPSPDDLILQLVKLRKSSKKNEIPQRLSELNVTQLIINKHNTHKNRKSLSCAICIDSDLELDVENIVNKKKKSEAVTDIIVGTTILKSKLPLSDNTPAEEMVPILYKSLFKEDVEQTHENEVSDHGISDKRVFRPHTPLSHKNAEQELPKGVTRYALSDRSFIDKGWTMLPTEKVVRKMNVYRMRPAHPEFDWFDRNKNKRLMLYDSGEKLAEFDDNGRGRWYYRNGKLALDYYDAEELNAQQRIVIYGSGEPDQRGRYQPAAILATFDYLGNGVVFDHAGKIRLKYNQTEGVVLDRSIGPVSHWKWHTLNDPPVLQQVMIDTQMAHKDPDILKLGGPADEKVRLDNEEMLAIEFDNFIKEKSKKLSQRFKPFQIKTKALKINEHFSLRVLDQASIYLIFRDGATNIKMNIGMILDRHEIVDTDTAEVGEVSNSLERFPARTDSLAGLQRSVAYAQRVERLRVERERRLRHPEPSSSTDRLVKATSRPMRQQLHTVPSSSDICYCKCRKPSLQNMYYDTRLM